MGRGSSGEMGLFEYVSITVGDGKRTRSDIYCSGTQAEEGVEFLTSYLMKF